MASRVLLDFLTAPLEDAVRELAKEGLLDFISHSVIKPMMEQGQWQDMHNSDPMDTRFLAANTVVRKQLEGEPEFLARMACRYGPECRYSHRHEATKVRDSHMRPAQSDQRDRIS